MKPPTVDPSIIFNVTDEFTREAIACAPARSLTAGGSTAILDQVCDQRGTAPVFLRMDNGPKFIANTLQGW